MPLSDIVGHRDIIKRLELTFQRNRIPSSYMFVGLDGIGKTTIVKEFARLINCSTNDNCGHCDNCRLFDSGSHPDFYAIKPDGRNIRIKQIKELIAKLGLKPGYAVKRTVVIKQAHKLNTESANSLLKLLEEPPLDTLLILTATDENLLPETILSRCQKIFFPPLSRDDLESVVSKNFKLKPGELEFVLNYSPGNIRKNFIKKVSTLLNIRSITLEIILNTDTEKLLHYFYMLEQWIKKDLHFYFLEFYSAWIRDFICLNNAIDSKLINKDILKEFGDLKIDMNNESLQWCFDLVREAEAGIRANASKTLALEGLLIKIRQIRRGMPLL